MALPKETLRQIWLSGYCQATVDHANTTDNSPQGSTARLEFVNTHIETCTDCRYAAVMKEAEAKESKRLGPDAEVNFLMGGDIRRMPGVNVAAVVDGLREKGFVTPELIAWMERVHERHDPC